MIVVTGATGHLGGLIVRSLLQRTSAGRIGVSVREPEKAADWAAQGVRVRFGDFNNPQSLLNAFASAEQLLIVSSNARSSGGDPLVQHRAAIEAAKAVGVKRIVYTSQIAASAASAFAPARDHAATEKMLNECGLAWTALRNGFYAESGLQFLGNATETGVFAAPQDGPVSWTAHDDLAEAAAIVLLGQTYDGPTPPLTGGRALFLADLLQITSDLTSRIVRREIISDEAMQAKMRERNVPEGAIKTVMGFYQASRDGEFAAVDPTLENLLGRPPISVRDVMAKQR